MCSMCLIQFFSVSNLEYAHTTSLSCDEDAGVGPARQLCSLTVAHETYLEYLSLCTVLYVQMLRQLLSQNTTMHRRSMTVFLHSPTV
jgi:hypothetical protein